MALYPSNIHKTVQLLRSNTHKNRHTQVHTLSLSHTHTCNDTNTRSTFLESFLDSGFSDFLVERDSILLSPSSSSSSSACSLFSFAFTFGSAVQVEMCEIEGWDELTHTCVCVLVCDLCVCERERVSLWVFPSKKATFRITRLGGGFDSDGSKSWFGNFGRIFAVRTLFSCKVNEELLTLRIGWSAPRRRRQVQTSVISTDLQFAVDACDVYRSIIRVGKSLKSVHTNTNVLNSQRSIMISLHHSSDKTCIEAGQMTRTDLWKVSSLPKTLLSHAYHRRLDAFSKTIYGVQTVKLSDTEDVQHAGVLFTISTSRTGKLFDWIAAAVQLSTCLTLRTWPTRQTKVVLSPSATVETIDVLNLDMLPRRRETQKSGDWTQQSEDVEIARLAHHSTWSHHVLVLTDKLKLLAFWSIWSPRS